MSGSDASFSIILCISCFFLRWYFDVFSSVVLLSWCFFFHFLFFSRFFSAVLMLFLLCTTGEDAHTHTHEFFHFGTCLSVAVMFE